MQYPRPNGRAGWTADWFLFFFSRLTMPNGRPVVVEPFTEFIIREAFKPGRVELLVLLPKGNGKTAMMAALAIWHLLVTPNANCYIGAATTIQAGEMWRFATHYVESEPELQPHLRILKGTRTIESERDQGFLKILASDDSKQGGKSQGYNPTLALLDELHAHETNNLYTDMRSGLFKNNGLLITITTAGWDKEGVLGVLRAGFLTAYAEGGTVTTGLTVGSKDGHTFTFPSDDGRLTVSVTKSGRTAMLEWANRDDEDYWNPEIAKLANPASWVTVESLQDAMEAPGITPWDYARYRCNVWTLGFKAWLPVGTWERGEVPGLVLLPGINTWAAVDMARYRDCAALVAMQLRGFIGPLSEGIEEKDRPVWRAFKAWVWKSGGPDDPVSYELVKQAVRELAASTRLRAVGYDPKYFDQSATELQGEGLPMEKFPQSHERMGPAAGDARAEIIAGTWAHDGDPTFAAHIMAGSPKDIGPSIFVIVKDKENGPPIDAGIAAVMANALSKFPVPNVSVDWW